MKFSISRCFDKFFKKNENVPLINQLEGLIESNETIQDKVNDNSELALVSNVLGLKDLTAGDIMVPRADIIAASIDTSLEDFVEIFSKNNFSQIPIYKSTLDDVLGAVRVRDFLPYMYNTEAFDLKSILRDVVYVVPSMQLLELLVEIKNSTNHMALVVDEFGGVDGLVTLQDVVSEIVGEIQQTHDMLSGVVSRQDGSYLVDAKMFVTECESLLGVDILKPLSDAEKNEPDVETLGGLTMLLAGRMPTRGETIIHPSGIEFEIADADLRRVKRIIVRKSAPPAENA